MTNRTPFTDRLAGALLALALLGAALSLFVFSFEAARQAAPQPETFLSFPRPALRQEEPVTVIDARGIPRRAVLPAPPAPQLAPPAAQSASPAAIAPPAAEQAPGGAVNACAPERWAALTPEERAWCQAPPAPPKNELLTSPYQSKDWQRFDAEMARKNTPLHLPGGNILGAAVTLLTNPGAFLEKKSYTAPTPTAPVLELNKADAMDREIRSIAPCPMTLSESERSICQLDVAALGHFTPPPPTERAPRTHASDADVRAAIEAANKRRGAAPPAALISAKPTGDADAKDTHGGNAAGPDPGAGAAGPGR